MQQRFKKAKKHYVSATRHHVRLAKRVVTKPLFNVPFAIAMVSLLILAIAFNNKSKVAPLLNLDNANTVQISYDKKRQTIPTNAKTVGELIQRMGIELHSGDVVEPSKDEEIVGDNFRINVYRAVPVTIDDGNHKTFSYSAATTPRAIAQQAGVQVYSEDWIKLDPVDNFLADGSIGQRVVIDRAKPIYVNVYGTPTTIRTHASTVADLLKEKNIKLGKDDTIQPAIATKLAANTQIFLVRNGVQIQTVEEVIAFPIEKVEDKSLSFGATAVRQQGQNGKKIVTYQVNFQNGKEIGRSPIQEVIAQEPVKQIVAQGVFYDIAANKSAVMSAAGIAKSDYPYVDYIISRESGWCHTKWQGEYGGCKSYHGYPTSSSKGYGLCQSTPATKMSSAGSDWATNPVTQLKWCSGYATGRYGSWSGAYNKWVTSHWW